MTIVCLARTVAAALWVGLMLSAISWLSNHGLWWATVPAAVAAIVGVLMICGRPRRGVLRA